MASRVIREINIHIHLGPKRWMARGGQERRLDFSRTDPLVELGALTRRYADSATQAMGENFDGNLNLAMDMENLSALVRALNSKGLSSEGISSEMVTALENVNVATPRARIIAQKLFDEIANATESMRGPNPFRKQD